MGECIGNSVFMVLYFFILHKAGRYFRCRGTIEVWKDRLVARQAIFEIQGKVRIESEFIMTRLQIRSRTRGCGSQ